MQNYRSGTFCGLFPAPRHKAARGGQADGFGAVTFVLPMTSIVMRFHGTWGRGDFFLDAEDLLTEPEHNQFWGIGLHQKWLRQEDGQEWSVSTKFASSAASPSQLGKTVQGAGLLDRLPAPRRSSGPYAARAASRTLDRALDGRHIGVVAERIHWDIDAYRRSVPNPSSDGQDREWLFGGRVGLDLNLSGVEQLRFDGFGGASIRWNRQYVRFTGEVLAYSERETNFWLDLHLTWAPDRADSRR